MAMDRPMRGKRARKRFALSVLTERSILIIKTLQNSEDIFLKEEKLYRDV